MKATCKRLTALLLALAMCLSLCSVQVWAADEALDGAVGDSSLCAPEEADTEVGAEPEAAVTEQEAAEAEAETSVAEPEVSEAEPEAAVTEQEAAEAELEEAEVPPEESEAEPEASVTEAEESEAPDADAAELTPCADSLPRPVNGVITLTENVVLPDAWQVGNTITLDLNGYGLSVPADQEKCVIKINSRGNLTLKDSNPNRVNTIILKDGRGTIGYSATAAPVAGDTVQVMGGFVTGGVYGGVSNEGSFTLLGGTIIGNTAPEYDGSGMDYSGAGVSNVGTFTMKGGTITRNTAQMGGGGVFLDEKGSFTMESGSITNNTAASGDGGGVSLERGSKFTLLGGTIANNTAEWRGGGVSLEQDCTFTMQGGAISGNHAVWSGGGVSLEQSSTFTLQAGSISGNSSAGDGGGVFVSGSSFTMQGGAISDNTAKENGGGVFHSESSSMALSGGTMQGNLAEGNGGGICLAGSVLLSGKPVVSGNKAGASQALSNAYFPTDEDSSKITGQKLVLSDKLEAGASIGVSAALLPLTITKSTDKAKGKDHLGCFTSDAADYTIWVEGDELELGSKKPKNVITAKNVVRGYSDKIQRVKLNAKALDGAKLRYKSGTRRVRVSKTGIVLLPSKFSGVVKITITADETKQYQTTTKTVTVTVPTATEIQRAVGGRMQMRVFWKKNSLARSYQLQWSSKRNFSVAKSVIIPKSKTNYTIKKLKKGLWYVRLRSTIGSAKSRWSRVRMVRVK